MATTRGSTRGWWPCRAPAGPPGLSPGRGSEWALVDGYVWTRIPGTDVEVRALTDRPLAVRYRASRQRRV